MAGPVSTDDIEDFVSSVRRLVSVDARNRPVSRDLGQDRLVLTPAHRVTAEVALGADPLVLTARVKDEAAVLAQAFVRADPPPASATEIVEAEWEEEIWSEPDPPLAELALGAEEAEVVTDISPDLPDPPPEADQSAPDTSKPESPWAEVGDDWLDEDLELLSPGQAPPMAAHPVDEAAGAQAKRPDVLKLSADDMLTDGEGNPLTVLDEAALQQIIRQLIRDELKGVLGERITQSVRKLVRAEINRALAAHALD
jgi:hypothetical protein